MAKYRKRRHYSALRRYGGGFRRTYRRGGGGGGLMSKIAPVAGGAGDVVIRQWIPVDGVGSILAGWGLKDQMTMKIGLNKGGETLGAFIANMLGMGGGSAGGGAWL